MNQSGGRSIPKTNLNNNKSRSIQPSVESNHINTVDIPPPPNLKFNEKLCISRCDLTWCNYSKQELFTPVLNCEMNPIVILSIGNEKFDDEEALKKNIGIKIHYRWSRGPARTVCFFHLQKLAIIQCNVTLRCFCSYDCFLRGQTQLKYFYLSGGKFQIPRQTNEFSYGVPVCKIDFNSVDEIREPDVEHFSLLYSSGLIFPEGSELMTTIGYNRDFVPTSNDMGHQILLEIAIQKPDKIIPLASFDPNLLFLSSNSNPKIFTEGYQDEAEWWAKFDKAKEQGNIDPDLTRSIITGCVVPMAPLIERRQIINATSSSLDVVQQRFIHSNTPLANVLGIGIDYRAMNRTARKRILTNPTSEEIEQIKQYEAKLSLVRKERTLLLTENAFFNWDNSANKHKQHIEFTTVNNGSPDSFTVMTWNVLADIYATTDAYPYSDTHVLSWNFRRDRILTEIVSYSPDIICLQEIQGDHFEEFFAPALLRRGYEGLYKQKTTKLFRGGGKNKPGRFVCDGCATFFKVPKFQLLDHFGIEFARVLPPNVKGSTGKPDKRINKDNVALVLCLEQIKTGNYSYSGENMNKLNDILVVANTHILANPEAPDVKIWQANTLTSVLTEYMEKTAIYNKNQNGIKPCPGLVICGDFNSTPTSAVYELVTTGTCSNHHPELNNSAACKWLSNVQLGHGLQLQSSYSRANAIRSGHQTQFADNLFEPDFTNYTHRYVGCLDYIFYDMETLTVNGTLDLVTELQLLQESHELQVSDWALPSPQRPSDHLPLLTRFEWKKK